jgi:hypothetical protein
MPGDAMESGIGRERLRFVIHHTQISGYKSDLGSEAFSNSALGHVLDTSFLLTYAPLGFRAGGVIYDFQGEYLDEASEGLVVRSRGNGKHGGCERVS